MFPFADTIPTKRWSIVTFAIVALNVLSLLWLEQQPERRQQEIVAQSGFVAARIGQLRDSQIVVEVPIETEVQVFGMVVPQREVISLTANRPSIFASTVTCMFLHGGWMHLIGNMWFLLIFGNNVEDRLGHVMYGVFYFLGGWAATATQYAIAPHSVIPMIGASGAVAAVLGAYAVTFPHARVKTLLFLFIFATIVEIPALLFMGLWFGMQLLSGLRVIQAPMESVAWWAHVGGFVAGAALMRVLTEFVPDDKPLPPDELATRTSFEHLGPRRFDDQGW